MKKILYSTIILLSLFTISCDDKLDRFPLDGFSPENYFNNETELKTFSNQFYYQLPEAIAGYNEFSDVIIAFTLSAEIQGSRIIPNSGGGWEWGALRNINMLLQYSNRCQNVTIRENYEGIARFFRAFFYFEKVKRFGDVPWYDNVLTSTDPGLCKPRDSREFIMTKIMEDLDFAIEKTTKAKNVERVTHWTALALKSRICLFEGTFRKYHGLEGWEKYLTQCVSASEALMAGSYNIYKSGNKPYRDLFASIDAIDEEVILARRYSRDLKVFHDANYALLGSTGGRPGMNKKIVNSYLMTDGKRFTDKAGYETMSYVEEMKDRDPRLSQTIVAPLHVRIKDETNTITGPDFNVTTTGYQIQKWDIGKEGDGWQKSYNDFIVYRIAEIYLNFAEAKAELGTLTQADLDISVKKIRDRVGMPNINMAEANASPDPYLASPVTGYRNVTGANRGVILEIRRERTIELVFEGHRYYDIIRWKEGKTFEQNFYGMYFSPLDKGTGNNLYGVYDMNDGTLMDAAKVDICLYIGTKPTVKNIRKYFKLGTDITLTGGTQGYIVLHDIASNPRSWDEEKDYLYPIPIQERLLTNGKLSQNPKWEDGLNFK